MEQYPSRYIFKKYFGGFVGNVANPPKGQDSGKVDSGNIPADGHGGGGASLTPHQNTLTLRPLAREKPLTLRPLGPPPSL